MLMSVFSCAPRGPTAPLFRREAMLSDDCPMKDERVLERGARVEIPSEEIEW
jgi:hypothetical protein